MTEHTQPLSLPNLAQAVVDAALAAAPFEISEGLVRSLAALPYRRLDCHGRALAFVRLRPRRRAVRVDVSSLWVPPAASALGVATRVGSAALVVRTLADAAAAGVFLAATIESTRAAEAAHRNARLAR